MGGLPGLRFLNNNCGAHSSVVRTAKLGADDWITSRSRGGEAELCRLSWNHVLLDPEFRNPEGMNHILGFHSQGHRPVGRNMQFTGSDVSFRVVEEKCKL